MELGSLKFRVSREEFADSVAWVARSLPSRPPVPVLGGVLLDATEAGLTVSGFDYEVSAQVRVSADVTTAGQALVSGRLLADITKSLPNKPVDVTLEALACSSRAEAPSSPCPRCRSRTTPSFRRFRSSPGPFPSTCSPKPSAR